MNPVVLKIKKLQKYKPFIINMIEALKAEDVLETQNDAKIKKLEEILNWINTEEKLPLFLLNQCEQTIKSLYSKCFKPKKIVPAEPPIAKEEISLISSDDEDDVEFVSITIPSFTNELNIPKSPEKERPKKSNFSILEEEEIEITSPITEITEDVINLVNDESESFAPNELSAEKDTNFVSSLSPLHKNQEIDKNIIQNSLERLSEENHETLLMNNKNFSKTDKQDQALEISKENNTEKDENANTYKIINHDSGLIPQFLPYQPTLNTPYPIQFFPGLHNLHNGYFSTPQNFVHQIQTPFQNGQQTQVIPHIPSGQNIQLTASFNHFSSSIPQASTSNLLSQSQAVKSFSSITNSTSQSQLVESSIIPSSPFQNCQQTQVIPHIPSGQNIQLTASYNHFSSSIPQASTSNLLSQSQAVKSFSSITNSTSQSQLVESSIIPSSTFYQNKNHVPFEEYGYYKEKRDSFIMKRKLEEKVNLEKIQKEKQKAECEKLELEKQALDQQEKNQGVEKEKVDVDDHSTVNSVESQVHEPSKKQVEKHSEHKDDNKLQKPENDGNHKVKLIQEKLNNSKMKNNEKLKNISWLRGYRNALSKGKAIVKTSGGRLSNKENQAAVRLLAENPVPTDKFLKKVTKVPIPPCASKRINRINSNKIEMPETKVDEVEDTENKADSVSLPEETIDTSLEKIDIDKTGNIKQTTKSNESLKEEIVKLIKQKFLPEIAENLIIDIGKTFKITHEPNKQLKDSHANNMQNKKINVINKNNSKKKTKLSTNFKNKLRREQIFLMRDLQNTILGKAVQNLNAKRTRQIRNINFGENNRDDSYLDVTNLTELPKNVNRNHYFKNFLVTTKCLFCKKTPKLLSSHYLIVHKTEVFNSRLNLGDIKHLREKPSVAHEISERGINRYKVKCLFCNDLVFGTVSVIIQHYSTHTGEFSFKCSNCNFMKPYKKDIINHCIRNKICKSARPKTYYSYDFNINSINFTLCNICNYVQINEANILKHLHTEHLIANPDTETFSKLMVVKLIKNSKNKHPNSTIIVKHTKESASKLKPNLKLNDIDTNVNQNNENSLALLENNESDKKNDGLENQNSSTKDNQYQNEVNKNSDTIDCFNKKGYDVPLPLIEVELKPDIDEILTNLKLEHQNNRQRELLLRLIAFFKCTFNDCMFATNSSKGMLSHLQCHQQIDDKMKLKCCYCDIMTPNANYLIKHMIKSHSMSLFQCNKCIYRSTSATNVRIHKQKAHSSSINFVIYACNLFEPNIDQSNEFLCSCRCLDCIENFNTVTSLKDHISKCHIKPFDRLTTDSYFACIYCFFLSEDIRTMREHLSDNHQHMPMVSCENFKISMGSTESPINSTIVKSLCEDESYLLQPSPFNQTDLNITDQLISPVNLIVPKFVRHAEIFKCGFGICDFVGNNFEEFKNHCETHSMVIYSCPHCDYVIQSKEDHSEISNHIQMHQSILYCCGECYCYHWKKQDILLHLQSQHKLSEIKLITLHRNEIKIITDIEIILPPHENYIQKISSCFVCSEKFDVGTLDKEMVDRDIKSHFWEMHEIKILYICNFCENANVPMDYESIQIHVQKAHNKNLYRLHCQLFMDNSHLVLQSLNPLKITSIRKAKRPAKSYNNSNTQKMKISPPIEREELIIKEESIDGFDTIEKFDLHKKSSKFIVSLEQKDKDNTIDNPLQVSMVQLNKMGEDTQRDAYNILFICFYCKKNHASINELVIHFTNVHPSECFNFKNYKSTSCAFCYYMDSLENPMDYFKIRFAFYFYIQKSGLLSSNNNLDLKSIKMELQKHLQLISYGKSKMYEILKSTDLTSFLQIDKGDFSNTCFLIVPHLEVCEHLKNNIAIPNLTNAVTIKDTLLLYGCDICKILSLSEKDIIFHQRRHMKPYVCKCHAEFIDIKSLQIHITKKHNGHILPSQKCVYRTQVSLIEEYLKMHVIFDNGVMATRTELYGTVHWNNKTLMETCKNIDDKEHYYYSNLPNFEIVD